MKQEKFTRFSNKRKAGTFMWVLLLSLLALLSLLTFIDFWYETGFTNHISTTNQIQNLQNGSRVVVAHTVLTIENYVPIRSYEYTMNLVDYSHPPAGGEYPRYPQPNATWRLKEANICINSYDIEYTYADQILDYPHSMTEVNPYGLRSFSVYSMSKTIVTLDWTYPTNKSFPSYDFDYNYSQWVNQNVPVFVNGFFVSLVNGTRDLFYYLPTPILFLLFSLSLGYVLSSFLLRNKGEIKQSFKYLAKLKAKETEDNESLSNQLKTLKYFPNQMSILYRLFFGFSVLLFKNSINSMCKRQTSECDFLKKSQLAKTFSNHQEENKLQLQDFLPELRYIIAGVGLLATIGISFSWNVGAILPFVYSIGLFYILLNIGGVIHLVGNLKKEILWILPLLIIILIVLESPWIIDYLRFGV
jgi:hypothetical protein